MVEIVSVSVAYHHVSFNDFWGRDVAPTFKLMASRKYGVEMMLPMMP
jgi:agmatine/peptidylarginine deiminase